jgi:hypothetical protein
MSRKDNRDVINAFYRLTEAAEAYVNRSPRVKRIETQRSALLDAIADAQLVLSVHRLPKEHGTSSTSMNEHKRMSFTEKELKNTRVTLDELEKSLRPILSELEAIQTRAQKARNLLDGALAKQQRDDDQQAAA